MKVKELIAELEKVNPEKEVFMNFPKCTNCVESEPLEEYHLHATEIFRGWDFNNKIMEVLLLGYEA